MRITRYISHVVFISLLCGCVSQKKYNDLLGGKARSDMEVARLTEVEKEHQAMMVELDETYATLTERESSLAGLREQHAKLAAEMLRRYEELVPGSLDELDEILQGKG